MHQSQRRRADTLRERKILKQEEIIENYKEITELYKRMIEKILSKKHFDIVRVKI